MPANAPLPEHDRRDALVPPTWARALDILTLLTLALAVIVAEYGGFRERIGGVRLALTSPYRLLFLGLILTAVRHVLVPRPPIYADLPSRLHRVLASQPSRAAWRALVGTRPAVLFVGYLAVVMIGYNHERPPLRLSDNEVANLQARWDAAWYFGIATQGYQVWSQNPRAQQNIVFFPAFPLLMRVTARLLGGAPVAFMVGGTIVAFGAFFWGLSYLFRLARELTGDDGAATTAVWLLAAYPFALFFSAVYTESLFLLGSLGAFYHYRRHEWVRAGLWGLLVGLTRPNGAFLSIALALLAVAPWIPAAINGGDRESRDREAAGRRVATLVPAMASAAMPGIGVLLYSAYLWYLTGDPLAWQAGHIAWGREYTGLGQVVADRYDWLANAGLYEYSSKVPIDMVNALGGLFVLIAAVPVARRLGLAYAVFILVNMLPPMAAGGMLSVGRFSSVMFPAFVWYASVIPDRYRTGLLVSFGAMQGFNAALFYTWRELF